MNVNCITEIVSIRTTVYMENYGNSFLVRLLEFV